MSLGSKSELMLWTLRLLDWLKKGHWKPWLQVQLYGLPPSEQPRTNLDLWLDAMDWSGIEELAIKRQRHEDDIVEKLPPRLTSLRRLWSTDMSFIEALPNNTLTHLTWIGPSRHGDFANVLERQGSTLEKLEFRCDEKICPSFCNHFNMSHIQEMAQNLEHLTIDIPRNGTWPLEFFQAIASLSKLRSLEIYLELQSDCRRGKPEDHAMWKYQEEHGKNYCTGGDQFQKPLLNENEAENLFQLIEEANIGCQLQDVTFRLGDWTPPYDGPLYFPPWIENRKAEVTCSKTDRAQREKRCRAVRSYGYWPPKTNEQEGSYWPLPEEELYIPED
ncbi:uncharacterized protein N0V89_011491 [Didymosphaeria variabile]|uniref:Uncharacterized protein n=1 Tax=Didymosphaeria variabile TaxID=1932322 RepID=A0A9W9C4T4_9PLEO|nr:uncharacterized protein N0V89_011491 [Didymosphaeria variabile]KAJ4345361.1 hypothetical protein N0V89_011491 [Didymosphaeria variabile]